MRLQITCLSPRLVKLNRQTMQITSQIRTLLDRDEIDPRTATSLLLTATVEILERLAEEEKSSIRIEAAQIPLATIPERIVQLEKKVDKIEGDMENYPPLLMLWATHPRRVILLAIMVFFVYTLIISPWMISDLRHALLGLIGLPSDFGLGGMP